MNQHIGSDFDDFLAEQGLVEEVSAAALKRVISWQIAEAMKSQKVTKKALAARMHTSRTAVDRALDQDDPGMTLATPSQRRARTWSARRGATGARARGCSYITSPHSTEPSPAPAIQDYVMTERLTSEELQLVIDNIRIEIGISGSNVATVKLKPEEAAALEHIKRNLDIEGRTFQFDERTSKLTIDSSACSQHYE